MQGTEGRKGARLVNLAGHGRQHIALCMAILDHEDFFHPTGGAGIGVGHERLGVLDGLQKETFVLRIGIRAGVNRDGPTAVSGLDRHLANDIGIVIGVRQFSRQGHAHPPHGPIGLRSKGPHSNAALTRMHLPHQTEPGLEDSPPLYRTGQRYRRLGLPTLSKLTDRDRAEHSVPMASPWESEEVFPLAPR